MKRARFVLLAVSLLPSGVLAWSAPGENFSGELRLGGPVTNTRNPWVWQTGAGSNVLNLQLPRSALPGEETVLPVALPALPVLLGKTTQAVPSGREGLAPRVVYGKTTTGFELKWMAPGTAEVTLPVIGDGSIQAGAFSFRVQAAGLLRHETGGQARYAGLYDDLQGNGLPGQEWALPGGQVAGSLRTMFRGDAPLWLVAEITVSSSAGVSRFTDTGLRQVEGVYGAQLVADSGTLRLKGSLPSRWRVSLPVSIEYQ